MVISLEILSCAGLIERPLNSSALSGKGNCRNNIKRKAPNSLASMRALVVTFALMRANQRPTPLLSLDPFRLSYVSVRATGSPACC